MKFEVRVRGCDLGELLTTLKGWMELGCVMLYWTWSINYFLAEFYRHHIIKPKDSVQHPDLQVNSIPLHTISGTGKGK